MMKLSDFDFELPDSLIARYPCPIRSQSRLLQVASDQAPLKDGCFQDVLELLHPGDLLVFNDTKVIPARLLGHKKKSGGAVEILVERILDRNRILAQVRASKALRHGSIITLREGYDVEVGERRGQFYELRYHHPTKTVLQMIELIGEIPLPPYMDRAAEDTDKERYQTVYAKHKGSVAAPTAGFHFDEALLKQLAEKQIEFGYLTLHIGAGTFAPVRVDEIHEHRMHAEYLEVSAALCDQIHAAKARGHRVIAVGTTSLRALETAAEGSVLRPFSGETRIFIYPGYAFQCADALITNLHLPKSTLLMLVCAFGGYEAVMQAYREAVNTSYRFYSYGDAMWVIRSS